MTVTRSCLAGAWIAQALCGQAEPSLNFEDFRTPDGSYFVLVPTGGPPVIHWVMATPAGVLEDPPGMEGLSFAVARSAMAGTGSTSSLDWEAESRILAEQDLLEQEWDRLLAGGEDIPETLREQVQLLRVQSAALTDPIAWERRLRRAPALGAELSELPEANLLHVTTSIEGLTRVALLLLERREGGVLRDIHQEFRGVRGELALRRGTGLVAKLRREVLGLSFLGHPFSRGYAATDQPRPLARGTALDLYRRTHHPTRTLHVLTGGFSIDSVRAQLERIFAATALPAPSASLRDNPPEPVARVSSIRGSGAPRVAMGFRIPPNAPREAVDVIHSWLSGGPDAEIVTRLRALGHTDAIVKGTAPFPLRSSKLFLLEIEDPTPSAPNLLSSLAVCLAQIAATGPNEAEAAKAAARARAAAARAHLGADNLAHELAIACAIDGKSPAEALTRREEDIPHDEMFQLAAEMLDPRNRTVVRLEIQP